MSLPQNQPRGTKAPRARSVAAKGGTARDHRVEARKRNPVPFLSVSQLNQTEKLLYSTTAKFRCFYIFIGRVWKGWFIGSGRKRHRIGPLRGGALRIMVDKSNAKDQPNPLRSFPAPQTAKNHLQRFWWATLQTPRALPPACAPQFD